MIEIITLAVGPLQANCHIIYCTDSGEAVVVDPGAEGERIAETLRERNMKPTLILNTHGHGDHIAANGTIKEKFKIPLAIHREEAHFLTDPSANYSRYWGVDILSPPADILFGEGDRFEVGSNIITALHTPGHSPGGSSFLIENLMLTGDALFKMSVGRTDLPDASHKRLIQGIREKILTLPDATRVYPGHGPRTTVGEERRNNPFLQMVMD